MEQNNFKVEVTETLQRVVDVTASSQEEAINIATQDYRDEKIVLDSSDYVSTKIDTLDGAPIRSHHEIVEIIEKHFFKHFSQMNKLTSIFENKNMPVFARSEAQEKCHVEAAITCFIYEILSAINNTSFDSEADRLHNLYNKSYKR